MSTRPTSWLTIATLVLALSLSRSAWCLPTPAIQPPTQFVSLADFRTWMEKNKGFGSPQYVEAKLIGLHVFVAWNCPFSGRNGTYVWAYINSAKTGRWQLLDSSFLERPEPLSYAYIDGHSESLQYVGTSGAVLKSLSLKDFRYK